MFGIIDVNGRYVDNGSASHLFSLGTDGLSQSRLGFRGVEDLGDGLRAGLWLEAAVNADTGTVNAQRFWHRRSTVSLISDTLGELRLGRDHTATFWNLLLFDPFTTGLGSAVNVFPPQIAGQTLQTLLRTDNAIGYFLPSNLGGVYGQATVSAGEQSRQQIRRWPHRLRGGAVRAAIAYGQTWTTTALRMKTLDFGISYEFGWLKLFGQYVTLAYDQWDRKNFMAGATVPVGVGAFRGSYTHSNFSGPACPASAVNCDNAAQYALGYVYNLSKRTALYSTVSLLQNDDRAALSLPGGPPGLRRGENSKGFEAGIRHAF